MINELEAVHFQSVGILEAFIGTQILKLCQLLCQKLVSKAKRIDADQVD